MSFFRHTPYDGSSLPFAVGLKPIEEGSWLEPDFFLDGHLSEKERLIALDRESVFRNEDDTAAAQEEVRDLIVGNLVRFHGNTHQFVTGSDQVVIGTRQVSLENLPALLAVSRIVQEDLVLMRHGPDGYRLVAASLCFPSSWSLSEKFGRSMAGIHETVPGFNGGRMGQMVARLFENLKPDQLLCRFNWSFHPDGDLHHPYPKNMRFETPESALARLYLRVERQTLRRLPQTGDILFTIKIHHDPLAALEHSEDRSRLAEGLKTQLLSLRRDQLAYKGLAETREALVSALKRFESR
ncbi:MAG: DUF3445 domain-containing protein [Roseibium sp.]|uniref:heme-dependent oxidative N-demethylase family protein n=1 Tax=Roseibium sp. TaxID=1936156 RepID=UPI002605741B|nr:DUF3445 domain-containing protein [Roseibium sp.]MCV0425746.1 DUF3445 domain-containing protein [Roseibium sp.]